MSEFNLDKLMRIDMLTEKFGEKGIETKSGFIMPYSSNHIDSINGLLVDMEGDNNFIIDTIKNNLRNVSFFEGQLVNGNLHFSLLSNYGCPYDYKLVKDSNNVFYGVSFEANYYVHPTVEECIPFSEFTSKGVVKVTLNDLKYDKERINALFTKCMSEWDYYADPDSIKLIESMKEENTNTIFDTFAYRGRCLAKRMFDKK